MIVFQSNTPLKWGELDLPILGIENDWYQEKANHPPMYSIAMDETLLWFLAAHDDPAQMHSGAGAGEFVAELWKYDVAEIFISSGESNRYIEINLAPNGAWWCCEFTDPRVPASSRNHPMPEVRTFSEWNENGAWMAAFSVPLDLLESRLGDRKFWRVNVTMILSSPQQKFFSAQKLPQDHPNFHQPEHFSPVNFVNLEPSE